MHLRFYIFFCLFSALLFFYPGDSYFLHIFTYNKSVFTTKNVPKAITIHPIPYLKTQTSPTASAEGIFIADLPSFTPIYEKNSEERMFPASTTKMVTALVVYDLYKTDHVITVHNPHIEGQVMGLFDGENITVENLLYGMLVFSGNDAAYAFANDYGYDKFIAKMNEKAKELHMTHTQFRNPAGLDDPDHYTTPKDLALAGRALLNNPYLKKIVSTKEITIADTDFKVFHKLTNVNELLGEIKGIGGLKTGYTEEAGENLISYYKQNGHEYIIVILKSNDRFADTRTIVKWIDDTVDYTNPPN